MDPGPWRFWKKKSLASKGTRAQDRPGRSVIAKPTATLLPKKVQEHLDEFKGRWNGNSDPVKILSRRSDLSRIQG